MICFRKWNSPSIRAIWTAMQLNLVDCELIWLEQSARQRSSSISWTTRRSKLMIECKLIFLEQWAHKGYFTMKLMTNMKQALISDWLQTHFNRAMCTSTELLSRLNDDAANSSHTALCALRRGSWTTMKQPHPCLWINLNRAMWTADNDEASMWVMIDLNYIS